MKKILNIFIGLSFLGTLLLSLNSTAGDCAGTRVNIEFPINIGGVDLNCGDLLGTGQKGTVYALVDKKGNATNMAIKIFFTDDKKFIEEEIEEVRVGKQAKLPIPGIKASFQDGKGGNANYIVKEIVEGNDLDLLFGYRCLADDAPAYCSEMTGKTSGAKIREKLGEFLKKVLTIDRNYFAPTRYIGDLSGNNIRWDQNAKEFKLIDYSIGNTKNKGDSAVVFLQSSYNKPSDGPLMFEIYEGTDAQKCAQRKAVEEILSNFITINNPTHARACPK